MENNAYILIFKDKAVKELENKNFTDDQRLPFYQALTKSAKELVELIEDEDGKNDVMQFVKSFISDMSRDETLTPQKALESFKKHAVKLKQITDFVKTLSNECTKENLDNESRISFYSTVLKVAKQCDEKANQNLLIPFAKQFVTDTSNDETLTPMQALENLKKRYLSLTSLNNNSKLKKSSQEASCKEQILKNHKLEFSDLIKNIIEKSHC